MLAVLQAKNLVSEQGEDATRSAHNDVRAIILQDFMILLNADTAIEDASLHSGHVLTEAFIFILDLESQFTSVAEDEDRYLARDGLKLLQSGQNEYGRLAHTRLGLRDDVHTE